MATEAPSIEKIQTENDKMIKFQQQLQEENNRVSKAMAAYQALMNTASKLTGR